MMLEVGQVLYEHTCLRVGFNRRLKVTRVTPKRAFVEIKTTSGSGYEIEFDREVNGTFSLYPRGSSTGYSRTAYYLETPEIKKKWERQVLEHKCSLIDFKKLTDNQLKKILEIGKEVE